MKTDRQLIEQLLELQEHPEQVTDEQLQQALDDPQMRELVEQMAFAKRAFKNEGLQAEELDVEGEWEKFAADHYGEDNNRKTNFTLFSLHSSLQKIAALFIGVLFITGMAFATIHIVRNVVEKDTKAPVQKTEISDYHQPVISADTIKSDTIVMATPVVFDNVTLDSIAKDIAAYHHIGMDLRNDQAKQLRFYFVWKRNDSLQEVVEKLNMFEHVNMAVEDGKLIIR